MISYRLAHPGGEYNRLYALMKREEDGLKVPLGWPTVVAEENGRVVGFLSTHKVAGALLAGPLVIEGSHRPWVFIRLVEAYETVLRAAGVTVYAFRVDKSNEKQVERLDRLGIERISEGDTFISYKRELK